MLNHLVQTNIAMHTVPSSGRILQHWPETRIIIFFMTNRSSYSWLTHTHYYMRKREWPRGNLGSGWDITLELCQLSLPAAFRRTYETSGTCWASKLPCSIHSCQRKTPVFGLHHSTGLYLQHKMYTLSSKGSWQGSVVSISSQPEDQCPS